MSLPWAATAALLLAVLAAGLLTPARTAPVRTDTLGPDHGEAVAGYLARAQASVESGTGEPRWGLVSFATPVTVEQAAALPGDPRIAQVLFRVPIERVQTPLVPVAVPAHREALLRAPAVAAGRLRQAGGADRAARVAAVSADRLADGCACVVGVVVRVAPATASELAAALGVRAVELLPADAVAGAFSVNPLLPEHVDVVAPGPDDGEP
ncbi:hypothetical protein [Rhodococcus aetherivorans]|uniref:hypothetical protein n=1 Tax=Rhodococcus aetherivorans TaxID=191292 RepID=UPI003667D8FB